MSRKQERSFAKFTTLSTLFSARAECEFDCNRVTYALQTNPICGLVASTFIRQLGLGECSIEIRFREPFLHADLLALIDAIEDCHVMVDTLEPLPHEKNRMARDYLRGLK